MAEVVSPGVLQQHLANGEFHRVPSLNLWTADAGDGRAQLNMRPDEPGGTTSHARGRFEGDRSR
ncbi:hypothetical protein PV350_12215 [Streptomyces sp. PA03-6a]|nr:hypothetical protein [Streptomyces sp. PA03-6a]